ncbi:MAG TPA: DMT family transporter [Candidatus Limiplasma sp.]|nr:DMT family transporter [Candidatus Limiplasma sp.]
MTGQEKSQDRQGYLAISICIVGVATSPLFYKLAFATGLHAFWINVFRLAFTTVAMLAIAFINPKNRQEILHMPKRAFWISALGGTLLAFHLNGWALALVYTETFAASTIIGTYVLMTVLFASLFLKERTSKGALMGLLIATIGVVVCNFGGSGTGRLSGNMFALFAAITEALYVLCGRKARAEISAVAYTTVLYSFTLFWMILMALFVDLPAVLPMEGVFWAGMLAIFSTLLGHSMANVALKYFKAATVSAVMMSGVITGPLLVLLFLQEKPTMYTLIGGTVIIGGLCWYMVMERREARRIAQITTASPVE